MAQHPLQSLIDAPLANALRINLPEGKRGAPRAQKPVYEGEFAPAKLSAKELRERQASEKSAKLRAVLDYYATTDTPIDRIAGHTNLTLEQAAVAMGARGRGAVVVWRAQAHMSVLKTGGGRELCRAGPEVDFLQSAATVVTERPLNVILVDRREIDDNGREVERQSLLGVLQ